MSVDFFSKFQALQSNLTQKDLTITQLVSQSQELQAKNSSLELQVSFLQNSNQDLQNQVIRVTQELQSKSQQVTFLENECNLLKNQITSLETFIENWKKNSMVSANPDSGEGFEVDRLKMIYSEFEARWFRENIELLENQRKMKDVILKLTDSQSQVLWEKREKWLVSLPSMEKVPQDRFLDVEEKEANLQVAENVQQVLKDVEMLLGWKIEYSSQKINLRFAGWSILVNKLEYLKDWYYNIELSSDSLNQLSSPPFNSLLTSSKNYPLLFALILSKHLT